MNATDTERLDWLEEMIKIHSSEDINLYIRNKKIGIDTDSARIYQSEGATLREAIDKAMEINK